ncbi:hypothetical protein AAHZ94_11340, partial [Streptomyces sp. HSW2009]
AGAGGAGGGGRLLAGRRLIDDPKAAWRTVSGLTLAGFVAGFFALLAVGDHAAPGPPDRLALAVPASRLAAVSTAAEHRLERAGVRAVVGTGGPAGTAGPPSSASTSSPTNTASPARPAGPAHTGAADSVDVETGAAGDGHADADADTLADAEVTEVTTVTRTTDVTDTTGATDTTEVTETPEVAEIAAGGRGSRQLTVDVSGGGADLDRARAALTGLVPGQYPVTGPDVGASGRLFAADFRRAILLVLGATFVVAAASAGITAAAAVLDRRRTYRLLRLAGTPLSVLDRARRVETVLPVAVLGGGAVLTGVFCAAPLTLAGGSATLDVRGAALLAGAIGLGLAGLLAASALSRPLLRAVTTTGGAQPQ